MPTVANGTVLTFGGDNTEQSTAATYSLPAGTVMTFKQTAAPTGWTKLTAHDDKQLRVVDGSAAVSSGGTVAFTSVYTSLTSSATSLDSTTMPSHAHGSTLAIYWAGSPRTLGGNSWGKNTDQTSGVNDPVGGTASHTHTYNLSVKYVDVILATKA